jgi:STAS-like domain of unknown function (DUF4325)
LNIFNFFGKYADDKIAAIKFRDQHISNAVELNKDIHVDFDRVLSAPHSFLNALLSPAIRTFGMHAYKKLKIRNAQPEIRETLDFIMDANTK